jgi:hypothetical protein
VWHYILDVVDTEGLELKWSAPDEEGLIQFLCVESGFNEVRIRNALAKLKAAKSKQGNQNRLVGRCSLTPRMCCSALHFCRMCSHRRGKPGFPRALFGSLTVQRHRQRVVVLAQVIEPPLLQLFMQRRLLPRGLLRSTPA